jgi:DNA-binding NarL/FixJ family response regulator
VKRGVTSHKTKKIGRATALRVPTRTASGRHCAAVKPFSSKPTAEKNFTAGPPVIRVALVDDDLSIHVAMRQIFKTWAVGWKLDSYHDGHQALRRIAQTPPNAVLMDISMPHITGIECTKKVRKMMPDLPIIMFTARADTESFISSMIAGASGYLIKPTASLEIIAAVKKVLEGLPALCPETEKTIIKWLRSFGENVSAWGLTAREQEILIHLCRNHSDKEMGKILKVSPATVHMHLHSIYKKLGVSGRNEARKKFIGLNE